MYLKIVFLVLCAFVGRTVGLRCYACTFSSVDSDQSCLTISDETHIVDCPYTFCTVQRQEFKDPSGVIASFLRGCVDNPQYQNHEVTDGNFRTFFRACTSDLCNIGDGIQSVVGGGLLPRPEYNGDNLLVPGTGNSAGKLQITSFSLLLSILVVYLW